MEVSRSTLETIYSDIVNSSQYRLPWPVGPNPKDKTKVVNRLAGKATALPSGRLTRAAWRVAALLTPLAPPPPPPPVMVKVAPITVREEGGSDQRVCLRWPDGSLRPGVRQLPSGQFTDESGALYKSDGDGLEDSSVRTKVHDTRLVGARSLDGRSACDCPTVGSASDNTGSWTV